MPRIIKTPTKKDEAKTFIATFLNIEESKVTQIDTEVYQVDIKDNKDAQKKYKERNPFGNTNIPKYYDFSKPIEVRWDGEKVQVL